MDALLTDADVRVLLAAAVAAETQQGFAERTGVSRSTVAMVLLGERRPNAAIAAALGLEDVGRRWRPQTPPASTA